ncbi:MAG: DEAD/DEAH box helicase [Acidobacteriota bacterium]
MKMINEIFSKSLREKFSSADNTELNNIESELEGLVVAGVSAGWRGDLIWVVKEGTDLEGLRQKLNLWLGLISNDTPVILYPLPFADPYINNKIFFEYHVEKMKLYDVLKAEKKIIIITTFLGLSITCEKLNDIKKSILTIRTGDNLKRDEFITRLFSMGYSHEHYVENPGEMKKRGGVLDLFPAGYDNPVRIEFFGDKVESITGFSRISRYSLEKEENCRIVPAGLFGNEMKFSDLYQKKNKVNITGLLKDPKLVYSGKGEVNKRGDELKSGFEKIYEISENKELPHPEDIFKQKSGEFSYLNITRNFDEISEKRELIRNKKDIREFNTEDLEKLKLDSKIGKKIFIFSESSKLTDNLKDVGIWFESFKRRIPASFQNLVSSSIFLTEKRFKLQERIIETDEIEGEKLLRTLREGDFVVHSSHGIGKFTGFTLLKTGRSEQEFLKLEYFNGETLYVPVYEINILNKYYSFKGDSPKLDRIGGKSWNLKKTRARKSIIEFAKELLDLYALRRSIEGNSFSGDSSMEKQLEDSFPFIETEDQLKSIKDVMADLAEPYPMERLVCGDVSFGKTEVAIRGAFKVVTSGKQVAVLCPTTILALQHFNTFTTRLGEFPVKIRMLSRMVSAKEKKEIISDLQEGKIDILIGTHSILSKKLEFRNLGLFIIDEEQRFGVFQKEKLKKGREDVDVLILSATPIPRTLSLSMAGLQDISTIRTPPRGRIAIKNFIGTFSREIIVSAVLKETERGGSVFIIYNSVEKIFSFREQLRKWLPEIPVSVIHAQMKNSEIENNLMGFIKGDFSILLSTTIIENGIDISGVNTLIVIEAENFGLTQLYQLRGRIGRGDKQAFAYFLTGKKNISEKAMLRLEGIRDHSAVGSGFSLAEYDLKLRGAGSLLGNKQHGHIEALGFDFYNSLLKNTIDELKGEKRDKWDGKLNINFKYSIDKDYIDQTVERMDFYSRIVNAESFEEIDKVRSELSDRFGKPGPEAEKIFYVGKSKIIARDFLCESVDIYLNKISFKFPDSILEKIKFPSGFSEKFSPELLEDGAIVFSFINYNSFLKDLYSVLLSV